MPLYGGTAQLFVRAVTVPDGSYLEVWGQVAQDVDPELAEGRLGPGGWVRSVVKFMTAL